MGAFLGETQAYPDTPWDCHICRSVGVVLGVNVGIYGSPMECPGYIYSISPSLTFTTPHAVARDPARPQVPPAARPAWQSPTPRWTSSGHRSFPSSARSKRPARPSKATRASRASPPTRRCWPDLWWVAGRRFRKGTPPSKVHKDEQKSAVLEWDDQWSMVWDLRPAGLRQMSLWPSFQPMPISMQPPLSFLGQVGLSPPGNSHQIGFQQRPGN